MSKTVDQIMEELRAPFPEEKIRWRVVRSGFVQDNVKKPWAEIVPYFDARDGMNRLDKVVGGENWEDSYNQPKEGSWQCTIKLRMNGEWVSKTDAADETDIESIKGGHSNSFRRACVKWGIGRYLYDKPKTFATFVNQRGPNVEVLFVKDKNKKRHKCFWIPPTSKHWDRPDNQQENEQKKPQQRQPGDKCSLDQLKGLAAIAQGRKWTPQHMNKLLNQIIGVAKAKELSQSQLPIVTKLIQNVAPHEFTPEFREHLQKIKTAIENENSQEVSQ